MATKKSRLGYEWKSEIYKKMMIVTTQKGFRTSEIQFKGAIAFITLTYTTIDWLVIVLLIVRHLNQKQPHSAL